MTEELSKALQECVERDDTGGARTVVLDRLRRAESWVKRAPENRKALSDAVAALGKTKDLETLIRALDQADHAAFKRFVRENPSIYVRRVRTADHLHAFVAEHGSPAARAALGRALREVDAPAGAEVARYAGEALARQDERAAVDAVERLVRRFDGSPEPDEVRALRKHLDEFVLGLKKAGRLDDLARALDRAAAASSRRLPGADLYAPAAQLTDLAAHFGSADAQTAWSQARARPAPAGAAVAKEAARLLGTGKGAEALDLVLGEVVDPLDDRHAAAGRAAEHAGRLNDALAALAKDGKLADLASTAGEMDAAFAKDNPRAIYVAAKHRLQSAVDRVGSDAVKAAWKKAAGS